MALINCLALIWITICGIQDYRTQEVSNRLTLTAIVLCLVVRLVGWLRTPWLFVIVVSITALLMWNFNLLGGADAKGWIVFSLVGEWLVIDAAIGMLFWLVVTKIARMYPDGRVPGYPGYAIGTGIILLVQNARFLLEVSVIPYGMRF